MVEDTPDDLVHELFTQGFWEDHPLGRPILGTQGDGRIVHAETLRDYFRDAYTAPNLIVSAAGNLEHEQRARAGRASVRRAAAQPASRSRTSAPRVVPQIIIRNKELEQSHVCLGTSSYPQDHDDRYASYVLNTVLGGSMSSRLFQNVREKRGLAYAVFSGLSAYRDAGIDHDLRRLRQRGGRRGDRPRASRSCAAMKSAPVPDAELRRAKDHLKGSLMLSLENTASRMSHLARQEIYFDRQFGLDETLAGVERVTPATCSASRATCSRNGSLAATVLGQRRTACRFRASGSISDDVDLDDDSSLHAPRDGAHLERPAPLRDLAAGRDSPPPKRWPRPASCRPTPRATSASAARSTSPASRKSSRSPSTTSSPSPPRSPSRSARRRAGCTSA